MIATVWRELDPRRAVDPYLRQHPRRPKRMWVEYGITEGGRFWAEARVQERVHGRWREISRGMYLDDMNALFPELAPYLKWDLFSPAPLAGTQWAAMEAAWNQYQESGDPGHFAYQASYLALPYDELPDRETPWLEVRAWLEERHPRLAAAFRRDMRELARASGPGFRAGPGFEGPKAWYPGTVLE